MLRITLLLVVVLTFWSKLSAQCGTPPVFTVAPTVTADAAGKVLTFTATTDSPTDFMPMWGLPVLFGTDNGVYDSTGSTSHSASISGFWPKTTYGWAVRVRKIVNGRPCPQAQWAFSASASFTTPAASSGTFDYWFAIDSALGTSPHHVVQGYPIYLRLQDGLLRGTVTPSGLKFVASGLPPFAAFHWPDKELWNRASTESTTTVANDTFVPYSFENNGVELEIVTNVGGVTPRGTYTITVTGGDNGKGASAPTHTVTWPITVDAPTFTFGTPSSYPTIPDLSTWQTNMLTYGAKWCLQTGAPYEGYVWYYDGIRVFYQISDYTGNATFPTTCGNGSGCNPLNCVASVKADYRNWVMNRTTPGSVQGWRNFTQGLDTDFLRTGDAVSQTAVIDLEENAAYSFAPEGQFVPLTLQRETTYRLDAERLAGELGSAGHNGQTPSVWMSYVASHVVGQLDQVCQSQNARYWETFMVGLQMESLIRYYEDGHQADLRIPKIVKACADYLYASDWNKVMDDPGAFPYDKYFLTSGQLISTSQNGVGHASILNMLIAPAWAWIYSKTGSPSYQTEGDAVWDAGVMVNAPGTLGWAGNGGKQFSQSYRWSFDYIKYRSGEQP